MQHSRQHEHAALARVPCWLVMFSDRRIGSSNLGALSSPGQMAGLVHQISAVYHYEHVVIGPASHAYA